MQEDIEPVQLLLAEDDPISRRFLVDALACSGLEVIAVERGDDALRHACSHAFAVLLLDRNLPGRDGISLLHALRADPDAASRDAPAIALSADVDGLAGRELLQAGFDQVLGKPLDIGTLRRALAAVLPEALVRWNDEQALAATGGQPKIVEALRRLLRRDLPSQRQNVVDALGHGQFDAAEAELHKLRAAAGFCGASELAHAVGALSAAPHSATARRRFQRACAAIESESG